MHIPIRHIFKCELFATGSEISLLVPVALQIAIDGAHHGECPNIELPTFVEHWLLNIFLNNV